MNGSAIGWVLVLLFAAAFCGCSKSEEATPVAQNESSGEVDLTPLEDDDDAPDPAQASGRRGRGEGGGRRGGGARGEGRRGGRAEGGRGEGGRRGGGRGGAGEGGGGQGGGGGRGGNPAMRQLVEEVQRLGAAIGRGEDGGVDTLDLTGGEAKPEVLEKLKEFPELEIVLLGAPLADEHLASLAGLPGLRVVQLNGEGFSTAGLGAMKEIIDLEVLELRGIKYTDEGLSGIRQLPKLWIVDVFDMPITDEDLEHLASLEDPRSLNFKNTKITQKGIQKLETAQPDCKVNVLD